MLLNKLSARTFSSGIRYMAMLPVSLVANPSSGRTPTSADGPSWEGEKSDTLERAEWLSGIVTTAEDVLNAMPKELGPNFGGEWAIYTCCFYAIALANISRLYPEEKGKCLGRMHDVIETVKSEKLRQYDTRSWHEDALAGIDGPKSHLSYLSLLAWIISEYRLAGGDKDDSDGLFISCCASLNRNMCASQDYNIPTFSDGTIFIPDMVPAIIALNNFSKLYDGRYVSTVEGWKDCIRKRWIHHNTGLIFAQSSDGKSWAGEYASIPRGSYVALTCSYLSLVDEKFAREQYGLMKRRLCETRAIFGKRITGIREYLYSSPKLSFDPDSGPIVQGLSASGTVFAIGAATRLGDWALRRELLATAEMIGNTKHQRGKRHYRLADLAPVGEAVTLAMKTNNVR